MGVPKKIEKWIYIECTECFRLKCEGQYGMTTAQLGELVASGKLVNAEITEHGQRRLANGDKYDDDDDDESYLDWATHRGLCEDCQRERAEGEPKVQTSLFV